MPGGQILHCDETLGAVSRPVTSELIARAGASLREGGWRYTRRQLYYATCTAAESPPRSPARNQFALAALLVLVSLILLPIHPAAIAVASLAALSLTLGVVSLLTRRPPTGRSLAVSYEEFEAVLRSDTQPEGLVGGLDVADPGPDSITVFCDTATNSDAVVANLDHAGAPPVRVLVWNDQAVQWETVIAVHDASPRGCALPLHLADAGARVVDAGLRPAWVDRDDIQVLEGAPARMPRDLSALLSDDESDWLRSGRRVELATVRPERLMRLVAAASDIARSESSTPGAAAHITGVPAQLGDEVLGVGSH